MAGMGWGSLECSSLTDGPWLSQLLKQKRHKVTELQGQGLSMHPVATGMVGYGRCVLQGGEQTTSAAQAGPWAPRNPSHPVLLATFKWLYDIFWCQNV